MQDSGFLIDPEPRRLTPEAIRGWSFPRVMRGADAQTVEQFREAVFTELCLLWDENRELAAEVARLSRPQPAAAPEVATAPLPAPEQAVSPGAAQATRVLVAAQSQVDQLLGEAREKADQLVHTAEADASRKAAKILAEAPIDAEVRVAEMMATGDAIEEGLTQLLDLVGSTLNDWRERVMGPGGGKANGAHAAPV